MPQTKFFESISPPAADFWRSNVGQPEFIIEPDFVFDEFMVKNAIWVNEFVMTIPSGSAEGNILDNEIAGYQRVQYG